MEFERIARDVRMSPAELRAVAKRGPEAADLLLRRMTALDLDPTEVSQIGPETFRDLHAFADCVKARGAVCAIWSAIPLIGWQDYCPNATLIALDALPWASRRRVVVRRRRHRASLVLHGPR